MASNQNKTIPSSSRAALQATSPCERASMRREGEREQLRIEIEVTSHYSVQVAFSSQWFLLNTASSFPWEWEAGAPLKGIIQKCRAGVCVRASTATACACVRVPVRQVPVRVCGLAGPGRWVCVAVVRRLCKSVRLIGCSVFVPDEINRTKLLKFRRLNKDCRGDGHSCVKRGRNGGWEGVIEGSWGEGNRRLKFGVKRVNADLKSLSWTRKIRLRTYVQDTTHTTPVSFSHIDNSVFVSDWYCPLWRRRRLSFKFYCDSSNRFLVNCKQNSVALFCT